MTTDTIRIQRVAVRKLFGLYDHDIKLHQAQRVTILHGINGVGKTIILRLLAALLTTRISEFIRVPFSEFEVDFTDGTTVKVQTSTGKAHSLKKVKKSSRRISITLESPGATRTIEFAANELESISGSLLENFVPWLVAIGNDQFVDQRSGGTITAAEALQQYGHLVPKDAARGLPSWYTELISRVQVHLIETQRLFRISEQNPGRRHSGAFVSSVTEAARDLQKQIKDALTSYARHSQTLDQSFPQRLLRPQPQHLSADAIGDRMEGLIKKTSRLRRLGLLDENTSSFDPSELATMDQSQQRVMAAYIVDTENKLRVLDEIADRVDLLQTSISQKFINKSIHADRENGIVVVGHDGKTHVPLESLSSGEQHEIVLFYDLLFRVVPGSLVLIDEPELSLHVTWQRRFLDDLLKIAKIVQFDSIIATHSPFIAGMHPELMVTLGTLTE